MRAKITADHLERTALVYVRQSTPGQVRGHVESQRRQYALADVARVLTPASTGPRLATAGWLCSKRLPDAPTNQFAGALARVKAALRSVGASRP